MLPWWIIHIVACMWFSLYSESPLVAWIPFKMSIMKGRAWHNAKIWDHWCVNSRQSIKEHQVLIPWMWACAAKFCLSLLRATAVFIPLAAGMRSQMQVHIAVESSLFAELLQSIDGSVYQVVMLCLWNQEAAFELLTPKPLLGWDSRFGRLVLDFQATSSGKVHLVRKGELPIVAFSISWGGNSLWHLLFYIFMSEI